MLVPAEDGSTLILLDRQTADVSLEDKDKDLVLCASISYVRGLAVSLMLIILVFNADLVD